MPFMIRVYIVYKTEDGDPQILDSDTAWNAGLDFSNVEEVQVYPSRMSPEDRELLSGYVNDDNRSVRLTVEEYTRVHQGDQDFFLKVFRDQDGRNRAEAEARRLIHERKAAEENEKRRIHDENVRQVFEAFEKMSLRDLILSRGHEILVPEILVHPSYRRHPSRELNGVTMVPMLAMEDLWHKIRLDAAKPKVARVSILARAIQYGAKLPEDEDAVAHGKSG